MSHHTPGGKANLKRKQASHMEAPDTGTGAALAPPRYGVDFVDGALTAAAASAPVQRQPDPEEDKDLRQAKFNAAASATETHATPNRTGLPDTLKAGVESLSGMDLSDVRVHGNSSKPAQLNALAYTQGDDIHVAPGQEKHLAHEVWHVVQQRQGRVKPTMQSGGVDINDDASLEREADTMGARAARR
jgi:hypothetical protein